MVTNIIGYIDRLEDDLAVIKCKGKELFIPLTLLPEEIKEGNWLEMSLNLRKDLEDKTREEVLDLLEKLKDKYNDSGY